MTYVNSAIDCRGLDPALTVLRIKQAIHSTPQHALPLRVRLGEDCARDAVATGLRALACDVRLVSEELDLLAETSMASSRGLIPTAHV